MPREAGALVFDLGIAADSLASLEASLTKAKSFDLDLLVTLGGVSVGDHDLVQAALRHEGLTLDFWRIAMRPGKPMMFGEMAGARPMRILGLPGNPVASYVCSRLFMMPLLRSLVGDRQAGAEQSVRAILGCDIGANDRRQDFLRASLETSTDGSLVATPFPLQDSSMLSVLSRADCLLIRLPFAAAAKAGDACRIIRL